jgi:hypothetical protein
MGQVVASSVSMLGALVSSGQDQLGTQAAVSISKLANYMRDKQFAEDFTKTKPARIHDLYSMYHGNHV